VNRTNAAFALLVVGSVALGAVATVGHATELRTIDDATDVTDRLSVTVDRVAVEDERLVIRIAVENPSEHTVRVRGASFRVASGRQLRVASGAGQRLDDGGTTLAAGGRLTARYAVSLSSDQAEALEDALEGGVRMSVRLSLQLDDTRFEYVSQDHPTSGNESESESGAGAGGSS